MSPLKIVVADDSRTIRTQLRRCLEPEGFEVLEAATGEEAVQLILCHSPFVAIVDITMPELDGYGVCLKLKELGPPWADLPIVLLTSLSTHALQLLGDAVGTYLKKPVDTHAVLAAVSSYMPADLRP